MSLSNTGGNCGFNNRKTYFDEWSDNITNEDVITFAGVGSLLHEKSRELRLRFGELRRLAGGVTQRSLTLQLRELESDGIVRREIYAEMPPRVEYSLTEFGLTLAPILHAMKLWGDTYIQRENAGR